MKSLIIGCLIVGICSWLIICLPTAQNVDVEPATSNIVVINEGEGEWLDGTSTTVYPLTSQEQITLLAECIEDATTVMTWWRNEYVRNYHTRTKSGFDPGEEWYQNKQCAYSPEIAIAFFNYRTGDK